MTEKNVMTGLMSSVTEQITKMKSRSTIGSGYCPLTVIP